MISNQKLLKIYEKLTYLYPKTFRQEYQKLMLDIVKLKLAASLTNGQKLKIIIKESGDLMATSFNERLHQKYSNGLVSRIKSLLLLKIITAATIPVIFFQFIGSTALFNSVDMIFYKSTGIYLYTVMGWVVAGIFLIILSRALAKEFKTAYIGYLVALTSIVFEVFIWGSHLGDFYQQYILWIVDSLGNNVSYDFYHSNSNLSVVSALSLMLGYITTVYIFLTVTKIITSNKVKGVLHAK